MRALCFNKQLYDAKAVRAAVELYQPYAEIETHERDGDTRISVTASSEARERRIIGELMNYVLGQTIAARGGA